MRPARRALVARFIVAAMWVSNAAGADELACHDREHWEQCMQQLPQMVSTERGIPSTKGEVDSACSAFKLGMKCIDRYAESCLNIKDREIMNENVAGARQTFSRLCDDPLFQSEYLEFSVCYKSVAQDWDMCAGRFHRLVRAEAEPMQTNLTAHERVSRLCCAKMSFLRCVGEVSNLKCRTDAAEFLHRIAETLANVRVYSTVCRSISVTCSVAADHEVPGLLLISTVLLFWLFHLIETALV